MSAVTFLALPNEPDIIPKPFSLIKKEGTFVFNANTKIYRNYEEDILVTGFVNDFLRDNYGFDLNVRHSASVRDGINFVLDRSFEKEAYELTIDSRSVVIKGNTEGLFYGLQSLLQLMPVEASASLALPQVEIKDKPRFGYRGAMLDVGRYFFTVESVKRFIDLMAYYKLNTFHWHLTEDAGWRIEIKKYPLLTQVGAWRRSTQTDNKNTDQSFDRLPHGGYYTQPQIRDIVAYARQRNVTIIPEIDMPGHMLAALAAYPHLSCTGGPFKVLEQWGIQKDVLCAGNEETYRFLEDVLDEVMELFPSEIIHIGGDEAPKDRWKECPKCQAKIKQENLKDEHELQSYFVKRIGKYLESKGRRMLGWDEIMEGGIADNAMIMSWRGEEGGIEAAKHKHQVVMAPTHYLYLDYYQGDPATEPFNIGGNLPLEKVYHYNPTGAIPEEYHPYVIGVQGNLWMEFIHSVPKLDYMAFPRLLAVSEIGWSTEKKDYPDFRKRVGSNLCWLDKMNVNFRIPEPMGLENVESTSDNVTVSLTPPVAGSQIYYTLDGSDPLLAGVLYVKPIAVALSPTTPVELKCVVKTLTGRVSTTYKAQYSLKKTAD